MNTGEGDHIPLPFGVANSATTFSPEAAGINCKHPLLKQPAFDEAEAAGMTSLAIRQRWPRGDSRCPTCGERVITYASMAHYIYGDW